MDSERIEVEGMHCGNCVARVRTAVEAVEGVRVESVQIGEVKVLRDPARVGRDAVVAAIRAAGYPAR